MRPEDIFPLLCESADKNLDYFDHYVKNNPSALGADLASYFKLPMMLALSGRHEDAKNILRYIEATFLKDGGFKTSTDKKSITNPEYNTYWLYIDGWLLRAANLCSYSFSSPMRQHFLEFSRSAEKEFLTNAEKLPYVSDVLTAAHVGVVALEGKDLSIAIEAGDFLIQHEARCVHDKKFYLREQSGQIVFDQDLFSCIDQQINNQLYFMIGYPATFLLMLFQETQEAKYREAAQRYLDFSLNCKGVCESKFSHKIALACSFLYQETSDEKYLKPIEEIMNYFKSQQADNGLWLSGNFDQSWEIAAWCRIIQTNLERCAPAPRPRGP